MTQNLWGNSDDLRAPQNEELERLVLSAAMRTPDLWLQLACSSADFYPYRHKIIYREICNLGLGVNRLLAIQVALRQQRSHVNGVRLLEMAGGTDYLVDLWG